MKVFVLLMIIGLASCHTKSAFDYSQQLVELERSLTPYIESTEDRIGVFYEEGRFDSIAFVSAEMERMVDSQLNNARKIPAPAIAEADYFKSAFLMYFEYMKSIYTAYRKWATQDSEEARNAEYERLMMLFNNRERAIRDMQSAQLKFASANGFTIED